MKDEQFRALGRLFAAHSLITNNVIGILGQLLRNSAATSAIYQFVQPADRVPLCLRLLQSDAQSQHKPAAAAQRLEAALRAISEGLLTDFSMPELSIDILSWAAGEGDPWEFLRLSVASADIERVADDLLTKNTELLVSIAAYMDERNQAGMISGGQTTVN